jgi:hypothetical protein
MLRCRSEVGGSVCGKLFESKQTGKEISLWCDHCIEAWRFRQRTKEARRVRV